jgi:large subunit ribosomal protein L14
MIQKETELIVADNSGAKIVRCFHIVGSTGRDFAYVGDIIICAVKKAIPGGKVKKGDIVTGVIVRVRKEYRRRDGSYIRFGDNAVVLIQSLKERVPVGTRVFGPVARELRDSFRDIVPLAPEVW